MKSTGKRPTRRQMAIMSQYGIDPRDWLVVKNLDHQLIVIRRNTKELKTLEI